MLLFAWPCLQPGWIILQAKLIEFLIGHPYIFPIFPFPPLSWNASWLTWHSKTQLVSYAALEAKYRNLTAAGLTCMEINNLEILFSHTLLTLFLILLAQCQESTAKLRISVVKYGHKYCLQLPACSSSLLSLSKGLLAFDFPFAKTVFRENAQSSSCVPLQLI